MKSVGGTSAKAKWIRRVGLAYGWFMAIGFVMYIPAYFGIPAHLNGRPPVVGVVVNGLSAAFVLMPYGRVVRWRGGMWVLAAFFAFVCGYTVFAAVDMARSLHEGPQASVFGVHLFLLAVLWGNCGLLYVWLKEELERPASC